MNLSNGRHIDRRVKDSRGEHAFVFWNESSFDPCTYLVRGENESDAYDWFLCDEHVERELKVEDYYEDYIEDWDNGWVRGVGATNRATLEELGEAYTDGRTIAITVNDNGTVVDTDSVNGCRLEDFARRS